MISVHQTSRQNDLLQDCKGQTKRWYVRQDLQRETYSQPRLQQLYFQTIKHDGDDEASQLSILKVSCPAPEASRALPRSGSCTDKYLWENPQDGVLQDVVLAHLAQTNITAMMKRRMPVLAKN